MDFYETIRRRRSVRAFQPCWVDDDVLLRITDAGRLAPSGCNKQNREFLIIRDRDTLAKLHERVQPVFRGCAAAIALIVDPVSTPWGSYWVEDAAAATENMLLATVAEGYDTVWVEGTLLRVEEWAKGLLGVPADKRLYVLLPIGKAASSGTMAPKADIAQLLHRERYGNRL